MPARKVGSSVATWTHAEFSGHWMSNTWHGLISAQVILQGVENKFQEQEHEK